MGHRNIFKNLKSNGFNLESLNFKKPEKIELLLGIVTICYALAIREGYKVEKEKGVLFKQSKGKIWKAKSVFRTGLTAILKQIKSEEQLIRFVIEFISSFEDKEINKEIDYFDRNLKSV